MRVVREPRGSAILLRWVITLAAIPLLAGCAGSVGSTPAGSGGVVSDQTSSIPASPTPTASSPAISQADARQFGDTLRAYLRDIYDNSPRDALARFLPETTRTAEAAVARDLSIARDNPDAFVPSQLKILWLVDGRLMPPNNDGRVMQSERDRLSALSKEHQSAAIVIMTPVEGAPIKRFVVKTDQGFYLVP